MVGVLFFIFVNFFSLLVWLVGKRVEGEVFVGKERFFFFLVVGLNFLLLFYHISKSLLYYFDEVGFMCGLSILV